MKKTLMVTFLVVSITGCASVSTPVGRGFLLTDVKGPIAVDDNNNESVKTGEACATNVLGLVASGDASIETAMRAAGISKVASVSSDQFSILGVFSKFCTVVTGK